MLKIYHKYILRKILIVFFASLVIISLCLVSLNLLRMIKHAGFGLSLRLLLQLIGYLNLFILAFSVPLSLLIACMLVFGKMSADNEISAYRASGLRISQIALPPFILAALLAFFMLYINGIVSPRGHYNMNQLAFLSGSLNPMALFRPRESSKFGQYTISVKKIRGNKMFDLSIMESKPDTTPNNITARLGELDHVPGEGGALVSLAGIARLVPLPERAVGRRGRVGDLRHHLAQHGQPLVGQHGLQLRHDRHLVRCHSSPRKSLS